MVVRAPGSCVRCGRTGKRLTAAGYCWPSAAWLALHPGDTGAGGHTMDPALVDHAARMDGHAQEVMWR